jgi:hypothetical protein
MRHRGHAVFRSFGGLLSAFAVRTAWREKLVVELSGRTVR